MYQDEKYAEIYIAHVLCLHIVPKMIVSDRGSQFVTRFWEQLHASLGTHLIHSLAYHLQTDGQTERVNNILEDMLRACVMRHPVVGTRICHGLSSHTTTTTKRV
jgi:transposase InsO family protein